MEGHHFAAFGFPNGHDNGVWAYGVLCGRQGTDWVQLEAEKEPGFRIEPGFSGTPIWDKKLKGVVGIAVAADLERVEAKVAFMIPTGSLVKAWSKLAKEERSWLWGDHYWAWASLSLVPLLSTIAVLTHQSYNIQSEGESHMECSIAQPGTVKIVIADFDDQHRSSSAEPSLAVKLKNQIEVYNLPNVAVCTTSNKFTTKSDIQQDLGQDIGVAVVIWGYPEKLGVKLFWTLINREEKDNIDTDLVKLLDNGWNFNEQKNGIELSATVTAYALSQIFFNQGRIPEARSVLKQAIKEANAREIDKENKLNRKILAKAYYSLGLMLDEEINFNCDGDNRNHCLSIVENYRLATDLDPTLYDALLNLAALYRRLEDPDNAIKVYNQILEANPQSRPYLIVSARMYRAYWYLEIGKAQEALKELESIHNFRVNTSEYLKILGRCQLQAGQIGEAEKTYQKIKPYLEKDEHIRSEVISELREIVEKNPTSNPSTNDLSLAAQKIISDLNVKE